MNKDFTQTGPFDVCHTCPRKGNGCSGPRTTAMTHERYVAWLRVLFEQWHGTRQDLADKIGISKSTIDDIFAGRRKDISRTTAGLLEDELIGGGAKWPCAMQLDQDKEIVYEDRPETLEALRLANEQIERLRHNYNEIRDSVDREMERVRDEYEDDVKEYKALVEHMREQVRLKDSYIADFWQQIKELQTELRSLRERGSI